MIIFLPWTVVFLSLVHRRSGFVDGVSFGFDTIRPCLYTTLKYIFLFSILFPHVFDRFPQPSNKAEVLHLAVGSMTNTLPLPFSFVEFVITALHIFFMFYSLGPTTEKMMYCIYLHPQTLKPTKYLHLLTFYFYVQSPTKPSILNIQYLGHLHRELSTFYHNYPRDDPTHKPRTYIYILSNNFFVYLIVAIITKYKLNL